MEIQQNPIPMTNQNPTLEQELISRYNQRLKTVFSNPPPSKYYKHPIIYKSELENKIKELNKTLGISNKDI